MKNILSLSVFLVFFSCDTPFENVEDLLLANLEATGGKEHWEKLASIKTEAQIITSISNKEVSKVKIVNSIKLPHLQKEETFADNPGTMLTIRNSQEAFYFKFENGKPIGYTEIEPEEINVKAELEMLENPENFKFEEGVWESQEIFKLINSETGNEYIYDQNTYLLKAHIAETPYGISTTRYNNYQERKGYLFAFKNVSSTPAASFEVVTSYLDIQVNPELKSSFFEVDKDWIVLKEGTTIPDFQTRLYGKNSGLLSNENMNGKIVLVDFWATWCKPCIAEFPNLKHQYAKYKGQDFEVISISLDENESALSQYLEKNPLPWINAWEPDGFKSNLAKDFQLASIPKSILIDRNGKILAMDTGAKGQKLNQLLASLFIKEQ